MKYLKKYESSDFNEIQEQLSYIFLDLKDSNIEVVVSIMKDFYRRDTGFSIRLYRKDNISLSDIYTYILTSMDYMRIKGIRFRAVKLGCIRGLTKNITKYFYDYMSNDVPDISFNSFIILFE